MLILLFCFYIEKGFTLNLYITDQDLIYNFRENKIFKNDH